MLWNEFGEVAVYMVMDGDSKCHKIFSKITRCQNAVPREDVTSVLFSTLPGTVPAEEGFAESAAFLHKLRLSAEPDEVK